VISRIGAVGVFLAAVACSNQKASESAPPTVTVISTTTHSGDGGETGASDDSSRSDSKFVLPPPTPGMSVSKITGCLTTTTPSEADATRFPAPMPSGTRGGGTTRTPIQIVSTAGGIVVDHELSHACCLRGAIDASVDGKDVLITEKLTGTACRCQCGSMLKTAVGLQPGEYKIRVEIDENGSRRIAWEGVTTVR
jgi:hypothetical protein